jgi:hypothetical protein
LTGCGCEASINDSDPRAEIWRAALGKTSVPIVYPLYVLLPDFPGKRFLQGDATALTASQKRVMANLVAKKFNISELEVFEDLQNEIFPILDEHVTVSFCRKHTRMLGV